MKDAVELYCDQIHYYGMVGSHDTFVSIRMTLDEAINAQVMEAALVESSKRFPYFQSRLATIDNRFVLVPNDMPLKLRSDPLDYIIDSGNNDGYLYRISANGRYFTGSFFHGLADGSSFFAI